MTAKSHHRGHTMYFDASDDLWRYMDDDSPVAGQERPCGKCGEPRTPEGHDPCLGTIPRVVNACCGHGNPQEAYLSFEDGTSIRGQDAVDWIERYWEIAPSLLKLHEIERKVIEGRLLLFGGDKVRTAESLGICLKTLYNRLRRYRVLGTG